MVHYPDEPIYSEKYFDDRYEYRHVILTKQMTQDAKTLLHCRGVNSFLSESEWRSIGVQQSRKCNSPKSMQQKTVNLEEDVLNNLILCFSSFLMFSVHFSSLLLFRWMATLYATSTGATCFIV